MGECSCGACQTCKDIMSSNAAELFALRQLVDDLCKVVGTGISVPEKFRPQVVWDMTEWLGRAEHMRSDPK